MNALPVLACLLAQAAPPPAPVRLAILPAVIQGPYGEASLEGLFESLSETAQLRVALVAGSYNEVFVDGAETVAGAVKDCGSDPGCASRALRLAGYGLGLEVIANFALDPPLITISLLDGDQEASRGEAVVELGTGEPLGERVAKEAARLLDDAGHPRGARLIVQATPLDSTVVVGSGLRPDAGTRGRYTLPPGPYRVELMHAGYVSEARTLDLAAGQTETLALRLAPIVEESGFVGSPWFWGALGLVAIGAATATVLVVSSSGDPSADCFCISTAAGSCGVCR